MPNFANRARLPALKLVLAAISVLAIIALWCVDPRVGRLWVNTACLAGCACLIALPLGTLLAVIIFKTDAPGRGLAMLLLIGMLFVPLYLVTGAWDAGFGIQGWHTLNTNPHLAHQPWLAGWRAAVWVHGLAAVPWVVLIIGAGLRAVEAEVEEDAATCAAPSRVLWYVSIRRALPAIAVAALWVTTIVMTEISVTDFFQVRTFAEEVYTQAALGTFDYAPAQSALSAATAAAGGNGSTPSLPTAQPETFPAAGMWSGLALSAAFALALMIGVTRVFSDLADAQHRAPWIWKLKLWRWPVSIVTAAAMLLLAGVPLANLAYKAGIRVTATNTGHVRNWSPWQLAQQVASAPHKFHGELWLSAWLGAAAATAALVIALPLAWTMRSSTANRSRWTLVGTTPWFRLLAISLCLTIPGPILGLALIWVMNRPPASPLAALAWLYDTNFAPWLIQTIRAMPLATMILWPALASIPQVMFDAAATDGTGWWGRLLLIAVPQRWFACVAAWLIAFAIAVGELSATVLVMPPQIGATALSIQVFQMLHYGVDDRVAAICLVMVAAIATTTGIAAALLRRRYRDT